MDYLEYVVVLEGVEGDFIDRILSRMSEEHESGMEKGTNRLFESTSLF